MNKETEKALEASIKHWEKNLAAEIPEEASIDGKNCALCNMFFNNNADDYCIGCPVRLKTGYYGCHRTPYTEAMDAYVEWEENSSIVNVQTRWRAAAKAELDFLIGLRENEMQYR